MVWDRLSWGVPYDNRLGMKREVQVYNKGRDYRGCWIGLGFMVYLSILRCGKSIIKSIGEIKPLGSLPVLEKLACKDKLDWPDWSEGPDRTGRGQGGWIDSSKRQIGSTTIES